ncbi:MAG: repair protein [Chitinophagaceae bacterium]|nr:repair protein [Chitinophagaceae bacterium]
MKQEMNLESTFSIAEVELVYRTKVRASNRPQISDSKIAFQILLSSWDPDKIELVEQFKILLLNKANRVLGIAEISSGGLTGTVADPRHIFALALKANAVAIILSHNHPSGNLKPSAADESLTEKLKQAGALLDIKILDHLIICSDQYYSFADEGLI